MYKIIRRSVLTMTCKILFRVKYENIEVLDKYDKCLICPNHSRMYDPIYLFDKVENMYSMAKSELFKSKFMYNLLTYHRVFPTDRENTDAGSLRKAIKLLKNNEKIRLLIFPEGKVIKDKNERGIVKNGAVYIASIVNVPIIPIYITARPRYFSKVTIRFGNPIFYNKKELKDKEKITNKSKELIKKIYELE